MVSKSKTPKSSKPKVQNNPFFIATNGITALFNLAQGVAIVMIIVSVIGGGNRSYSKGSDDPKRDAEALIDQLSGWTFEQWALAITAFSIIGLAILMVSSLFAGVSAYTAAEISKGHRVSVKDAFRVSFNNLWSFIWLQIIMFVKLFLWSLLFILPGIYFTFRYVLAGVAFYDSDKNLRGNAAIKESLKLTKNGWLTTMASSVLLNLITFGILSNFVSTGVKAELYKQYSLVGDKKPQAHWLSWLTLFLPLIAFITFVTFIIALITGIAIGGQLMM